jgi:hypothetical protein
MNIDGSPSSYWANVALDRKWPRLDQIDAFDPEQTFAVARRSRIVRRACPMLFAAYRSMQGLAAASTAMLYQLSAKR